VIVLIDLAALLFIWLIPDISRITQIPFYLLEPARLMLILILVHTTRINTLLMAVALPVFMFTIGGHPHFSKMLLLITELLLNAGLFFVLVKWIGHPFLRMALSIAISKGVYYLLKFFVISGGYLEGPVVSTPLYIQTILLVVISTYTWLIFRRFKSAS